MWVPITAGNVMTVWPAQPDLEIAFAVGRDEAEVLLKLAHSVKVGRAVQRIAAALQQVHQARCHVTARHIQALGEMGEGAPLNNRDDVGHTVSNVNHQPCHKTCAEHTMTSKMLQEMLQKLSRQWSQSLPPVFYDLLPAA